MIVSVVVPTYKRLNLLAKCLDALQSQDLDPTTYEIIVVDDAADEGTREYVEGLARRAEAYSIRPLPAVNATLAGQDGHTERSMVEDRNQAFVRISGVPLIRYIPMLIEHGPAAARNAGWRAALSEIIAFTDDDTLPSSTWLRMGVSAFQGDVAGVAGKVIMPMTTTPTDYEKDALGLERSSFVTANCFYLRSVLVASGGFDIRYKTAWREDTDLYFTLLEMGNLLVTEPRAVVVHPIRPAGWGISLRQQKKSQYNALLYKKHPRLYREKIQGGPPWLYYAILVAAITSLLAWVWISPQVGTISAGVWGLLTGVFCGKRLVGTRQSPGNLLEMVITSILIPPISIYWRLRGAVSFRVIFF